MPKLKKPPEELQNQEIVARIYYGKRRMQTTNQEIALAIRITPQTFCNRLKNPGGFRLDELRAIAKKLHMPLMVLLGEQPIRNDSQ
jgi:hypothetical protein